MGKAVFGYLNLLVWVSLAIGCDRDLASANAGVSDQGRDSSLFEEVKVPTASLGGVVSFTVLDASSWMVVDEKNQLWRTSNRGESWKQVAVGMKRIMGPQFRSESLGHVIVDSMLLRSIDKGNTWDEIGSVLPNVASYFFLNEFEGWLLSDEYDSSAGYFTRFHKTVDGGVAWKEEPVRFEDAGKVYSSFALDTLFFQDPNRGHATGSGHLLISIDGGYTWKVKRDIRGLFEEISFSSPTTGWLVEKNIDASLFTIDGGRSWLPVELPPVQRNSAFYVFDNGSQVVLDSRGFVFARTGIDNEWYSIDIADHEWQDFRNRDVIGESFIVSGFDDSVVIAWFPGDKVVSLISFDNGITWQHK